MMDWGETGDSYKKLTAVLPVENVTGRDMNSRNFF